MPINTAKLNRAIQKAHRATVQAYSQQCKAEIQADKWEWDGLTQRSTGEIVGSPRDIVDTGALLDSQEIIYRGANYAVIEWSVDYAGEVHEGTPDKPGRPWTKTALQEIDLQQVFADELRKNL
jgi:hypothetical protein